MRKMTLPMLLLAIVSVVIISSSISQVMAESQDGAKSYKRYWSIPIGDASGSLEITKTTDKAELKKSAISLEQVTKGYANIHKANLGVAVNDDGKYFLVWKLTSFNYDSGNDANTKTVHVLDAKTGKPLIEPITQEGFGNHGSCANKDKSKTTQTSAGKI
jgi:hypothetical protein